MHGSGRFLGPGLFSKALVTHGLRPPQKVNLDGNAATEKALRDLKQENPLWRKVEVRFNAT